MWLSLRRVSEVDVDANFLAVEAAFARVPVVPRVVGDPNGQLTGNVGDLAIRTDGGAGTVFWVKESGAAGSDTGWVGK